MLRRPARHVTYANVLSTLALVVALGGTSYAAVELRNNSVRSKHIKDRQVKKPDIARNAVNSQRVQNQTLEAEDFAPGQLRRGPAGPTGPRGLRGAPGAPVPSVTSGFKPIAATVAPGTTVPLLTVGPIAYTAVCVNEGAGSFRLDVKAQSSEAGAKVAAANGHSSLTGTPSTIWFEFGTTDEVTSQRHQVITPSGHSHRAAVIVGTHQAAGDCLARVDVDA